MIQHAPLQTYGSLLFFAPVASKVRQIFWNQRMPGLGTIQGVKFDWDAYLQTLKGHDGYISAIAVSPDSQIVASGSSDNTVQLWSAITGAHLQTLEAHANAVDVVVFSDNKTLASGSRDGTVRIWNLPTGKLLHTLRHLHGTVTAVVFLPDGEHLASASTSSFGSEVSIRIWNLKTGAPPKELFQSSRHTFRRVAFSPDSQLMASGLSDNTIEIWDFPTVSHRYKLKGHSDSITTMVFSHNNQLLASASFDDHVRLWNIEDGVQIFALQSHLESFKAIAFSPDGRLLASSWPDQDIRIWNVADGTHQDTLSGHQSSVITLAFSADSRILASGSPDKTIRLWDAEMHQHQQPTDIHRDKITTVILSPDGQLVATSSFDKTVRLWEVSTGACLRALSGHDAGVDDITFSPDGKLLASFDGSVWIWDVESGTIQQKIDEQNGLVTAVNYSADGQLAAFASFNTVTLYDAETGSDLLTLEGHSDYVDQVVFPPIASFSRLCRVIVGLSDSGRRTRVCSGIFSEMAIFMMNFSSPLIANSSSLRKTTASFFGTLSQTGKSWRSRLKLVSQALPCRRTPSF